MKIRRWTGCKKIIKIKWHKLKRIRKEQNGINSLKENGGEDMATATFDRTIILNSISAEKLINKIEYDKNRQLTFQEIDVQQELKESAQSLRRLLSR